MKRDVDEQFSDAAATADPALGLHLDADTDGDAVAGSVLRAQAQGYDVFVATPASLECEARTFVKQLEAEVVEVSSVQSEQRPQDVVATKAREAGFPGMIWQSDASMQVDFERSIAGLLDESSYVVNARRKPVVSSDSDVLVAIPAYNEADMIPAVVREAQKHADEVVVIDDGSDDGTAARGEEAGATVVQHDSNRGYGAALTTAFEIADCCQTSHLVILDGDNQHDPSDIPRLIDTQTDSGAEIVVGNRFAADSETDIPLYRRVGLGVMNLLTNLSMGVVRPSARVQDTQCGFRAYNRRAIESLAAEDSIATQMGASTDILCHAHVNDYEIAEAPASVDYDVDDASTHSPLQHGVMLIMNLVRTVEQERPISAVGVPGFISVLFGVGFSYWTISNFLATGIFPGGLALVSTFFLLIGVFACFTAIILHSLNTQLPDR